MKTLILSLTFLLASTICFGQTATYDEVLNKKKRGIINTYISADGLEINIYDTLQLGVPRENENFDYIMQAGGMYPLQANASGSIVIIKKMKIYSGMLTVKTTKPHGYVYGLYIANLEGAMKNGEVMIYGHITTEEALRQLKLEKDKLDLGLITQEEYDERKNELRKFIK